MNQFVAENGDAIYYEVEDNYSERPKIVHGVEKIGRYIYYYDSQGQYIKFKRIYGEYDAMQNISPMYAKQVFEMADGQS